MILETHQHETLLVYRWLQTLPRKNSQPTGIAPLQDNTWLQAKAIPERLHKTGVGSRLTSES